MKSKLVLVCLVLAIFIFMMNFSSAEIHLGSFSQGSCVNLVQICSNCTQVNVTKVLRAGENSTTFILNAEMEKSGTDYNYSFCDTDILGKYFYYLVGDKDGGIEVETGDFEITPNGSDLTFGIGIAYGIIILVLIIFVGICLYFFKESDNLRVQLFNFGMAYLILTLLFFVLWQFNENYLVFGAINVILKWIFVIMMIGFFVLFVLMIFKVLKEMYDNKDVQRLMNKGMTEEEARERIRRKRRRR